MNIVLLEKDERTLSRGDERFQHIRKVLHKGVGDSFHCGIVNSFEGNARIVSLSDEEMELEFTPSFDSSALYPLTVIVAQVRPICMKRILRELVSLGVSRIILTTSELGEKSYRSSGLYTEGEYRKIMLSGAMQGGHTGVAECIFAGSVREADSGLHFILELNTKLSDDAVKKQLDSCGIHINALSEYYHDKANSISHQFVISYSNLKIDKFKDAIKKISKL